MEAPGDPSYDKLYDDIMNSSGTFEMESDYAYSEGDNRTVIEVNQSSLVINGNNHIIDGSGRPGISTPVYVNRKSLTIENCTFENFTAKHGGAAVLKGDALTIRNSKFRNLNATVSGGAIYARYFPKRDSENKPIPTDDMAIENCEFTNITSAHNGGAICLDLDSCAEGIVKTLYLSNCNITNTSSQLGGAIASMGRIIDISNVNIINAYASGWAVQSTPPGQT
jgi:hypothetical protein